MGLKDIFGKKSGKEEEYVVKASIDDIDSITPIINHSPDIVSMNDGVNICAKACASCWDTKLPDKYSDRAAYIGRRTKTGHTSIIEHSNVVFYVPVKTSELRDMVEFLSNVRYANTVIQFSEKYPYAYLLIGGSWRAYSDIYLMAKNIYDNVVMRKLTQLIYQYIPSDGMRDIIDMGLLDESQFANNTSNEIIKGYSCCYNHRLDDDINIVNMDSITAIRDAIGVVCPEPYLFTYKDMMKLLSVTIEFNNMSRIITQQLTRHRNGITQESQRYVNYKDARFNSPDKFRPDKYDKNAYYTIKFGGVQVRMNLQTIGENICKIYSQLTDKMMNPNKELLKEDARGYLPGNTQCGKVFMTFTYYSLIKFLQLREDPHAQAEIRSYAERIGKWFREALIEEDPLFNHDIMQVLLPNMVDSDFTTTTIQGRSVLNDNYIEHIDKDEYANLLAQSIEYADTHPETDNSTAAESE